MGSCECRDGPSVSGAMELFNMESCWPISALLLNFSSFCHDDNGISSICCQGIISSAFLSGKTVFVSLTL